MANSHARGVMVAALILGALMVGCSSPSSSKATPTLVASPSAVASPSPDKATRNYVALVQTFWARYRAAEADAGRTCFGGPNQDLSFVDPPTCRARVVAILPLIEKFLVDLDSTPPPPKFAGDDQAFRSHLPRAIADLKALVSAAKTGDKGAVLEATAKYVDVMIPIVTNALNDVDPSVVHS